MKNQEVEQVFNEWKKRQKRPQLCRLTKDRKMLILSRLNDGYTEEDLIALIKYAYESSEAGPKYWRGGNDQRRLYLDLTNLLRIGKLASRVELAHNWLLDSKEGEQDNYGPFRLIRGSR